LETQLKTARDKVAHLYARWHELDLLQSVPSPWTTKSDAKRSSPADGGHEKYESFFQNFHLFLDSP
jgi:hypothetical protein